MAAQLRAADHLPGRDPHPLLPGVEPGPRARSTSASGPSATSPATCCAASPTSTTTASATATSRRAPASGVYCLMGSGNHLGQGRAPAAISGYLRDLVGWPDEVVPLDPGEHELRQGDYRRVHRFSPTGRLNEYFVVENRSREGTDASLPSSRAGRLPLRHARLQRVGGGHPRAPLPARAGPGRRPPRPRGQPQHRRRDRPLRRRRRRGALARHRALVAPLGRHRLRA